MIDVLEEGGENAVQQEIRTFIAEMDEEEKADLIGLLRPRPRRRHDGGVGRHARRGGSRSMPGTSRPI